jgi:hypothetical protein
MVEPEQLLPGRQHVEHHGAGFCLSNTPRPQAVHVLGGHWDKIDLLFDTGIR